MVHNMSYGLIIPIAVSLIFMIEVAAPRAQSALEGIMTTWGNRSSKDRPRVQKLSTGLVLPTDNMSTGNNCKQQGSLIAPTLLGDWVRSTTNVGRSKSVKIHACAPEQRQGKSETTVKFIENRPFVHGVLAACYATNI